MNDHPADYPNYNSEFNLKKFFNSVRSVTHNAGGLPWLKFIEPAKHEGAKDKVIASYPRSFGTITPIISEVQNYARYANAFMTPALFGPGGKDEERNITGLWAGVLDEDTDKGEFIIIPPNIRPTFIIKTSETGGKINRQVWFFFDRIVPINEARKLLELLHKKCGGDPCIKNPAQYFRIPGTLNHPSLKKIERGRSSASQDVKIIGGAN
jgi:hypothetical protein